MSLFDGGIADEIRIESDEHGFELVVESQYGRYRFNIHGIAVEMYDTVRREIGPYVQEMETARATMPPSYDPAEAYDPADPKHPTFHDRMSAIHDNREGK